MPLRILVVEGNTSATCALIEKYGGTRYGEFYAALLQRLAPGTTTTITRPADKLDQSLTSKFIQENFDGVVWTGSAMSVYEDIPEVTNQLRLADRVIESQTPAFGSCWGLQIFATALGGKVRHNPKGREIGLTAPINLTEAGESHPMYTGKPHPFSAYAVHSDEVERMPEGATVLATNPMSQVQAFAYNQLWAVQYHPDFDDTTMASTYRRQTNALIKEQIASSPEEVESIAKEYESGTHPPQARTKEIENWLNRVARSN